MSDMAKFYITGVIPEGENSRVLYALVNPDELDALDSSPLDHLFQETFDRVHGCEFSFPSIEPPTPGEILPEIDERIIASDYLSY